jgi:tetratricopeptide (TPR) repeat protein
MKTIGMSLALTVAFGSAALALPKSANVGKKSLYIKSCEVVGVDSQSCVLCTDEGLTKDCKEYLCDRMNPPSCMAVRPAGPAYGSVQEALAAVDFYTADLSEATAAGDLVGTVHASAELGLAYSALGEARRAIGLYDQALGIARELGDREAEASILSDLGLAWFDLGDARRALDYHQQTLAVVQETRCRRGIGHTYFNLSLDLDRLGRRAEAVSYARAALAILDPLGDPNAFTVRRQLSLWR